MSGIYLVFQEGDTLQCVTIEIVDNELLEFDETFFVDLVADPEGPYVPVETTNITIIDDDGGMLMAG